MGDYARTNIKYSDPSDPEGKILTFEQGEEVAGIDEESLQALRDNGAVGDPAMPDNEEALAAFIAQKDAEIAELKQKLGLTEEEAPAEEAKPADAPAKAEATTVKKASAST
jgi:hypothetical protein